MRLLLGRAEAAEALGISAPYFDRHVRPHLTPVRIGTVVKWKVSDLERWIDQHTGMSQPADSDDQWLARLDDRQDQGGKPGPV